MQDASKMPKRMALFIRKMESNGFQMKKLDVKLSSAEKQECLANGTRAKQMGYILKAYYKFRSFFKDEMKGTYFPENIYVFNRNQNGEQSNFFVFARWNWSRGVELMYSNPLSPEKGGTKLKK
ncbi:hypothetical protein KJ780_03385, partial [Candidatus Micrarchaeota archaeon]|nr:hypothetical protein [Candidatus Micrarchaeota archaeon]